MRKTIVFLILILLPIVCIAAVPQKFSLQGYLPNISDGDHSVVIKLYKTAEGITPEQQETQTVSFSNGIFSIIMPLADTVLDVADAPTGYLGLSIDGAAELSPRYQILSMPYAFWSSGVSGESAYVLSDKSSWIGVQANALSSDKIAVRSIGLSDGILGMSNATGGYGVVGYSRARSSVGVKGQAFSAQRPGVNAGASMRVRGKIIIENDLAQSYAKPCGIGTIEAGEIFSAQILNPLVHSEYSSIFLSVIHNGAMSQKGIKVYSKTDGTSFVVSTIDGRDVDADITFKYLIIN